MLLQHFANTLKTLEFVLKTEIYKILCNFFNFIKMLPNNVAATFLLNLSKNHRRYNKSLRS